MPRQVRRVHGEPRLRGIGLSSRSTTRTLSPPRALLPLERTPRHGTRPEAAPGATGIRCPFHTFSFRPPFSRANGIALNKRDRHRRRLVCSSYLPPLTDRSAHSGRRSKRFRGAAKNRALTGLLRYGRSIIYGIIHRLSGISFADATCARRMKNAARMGGVKAHCLPSCLTFPIHKTVLSSHPPA